MNDFTRLESVFAQLLNRVGVTPTRMNGSESPYVERAGIMAGVGTLLAIETGAVKPGESVLCSFTGGAGAAPQKEAKPEFIIDSQHPLRAQLDVYLDRQNSRPTATR